MKVKEFEFSFTYLLKRFKASCSTFQPDTYLYPLYRVLVNGKDHSDVYIFYEVDEEREKFFWYPLDKFKQPIAKAISGGLEKYLKRKKTERRRDNIKNSHTN